MYAHFIKEYRKILSNSTAIATKEKKITVHRTILCEVLREVHLVVPCFFSHFARIIHLRLSTYGFTMNYEFTATRATHVSCQSSHNGFNIR